MTSPVDRYQVNDELTALAAGHGITLDDTTLDGLTHTVADALDAALTTPGPR